MRAVVLLAAVIAVLVGPRLAADRLTETLGSAVVLVAGLVLAQLTAPLEPISGALDNLVVLFALPTSMLASFRALLRQPNTGGVRLTLMSSLCTLVASGRVQQGILFPLAAFAFIVFALLALRNEDVSRAPLAQLSRFHAIVLIAGFSLGIGLAVGMSFTLPKLYEAVVERLSARWSRSRAGFSDSMELGSLAGLEQSERVVVRVRGDAPPLIRGMTWDNYNGRRWEAEAGNEPREVVETPVQKLTADVELEFSSPPDRYFVPLGAADITTTSGVLERDVYGNLWVSPGFFSKRIWFDEGNIAPPRAPSAVDLAVPNYLQPTLDSVLRSWGISRSDPPSKRVEMIESRLLSDYVYSTDFERNANREPIIDFLLRNKQGHCEYFASAFTLLARRAEVPARLVGGYRVVEQSPFGYAIVRERHAHAWSEIWLSERWQTMDPTPMDTSAAAQPTEQTRWFPALLDGVRTTWEIADDWLAQRTGFEMAMALVVLGFGWLLLRLVRGRKKQRLLAEDKTLPELVKLLKELRNHGITLGGGDTFAVIRAKLDQSALTPQQCANLKSALNDYEGFTYGGLGDATAIRARLASLGSQLRESR
jgi:transglutaminase-like putative cysteine protease